MNFSISMTRTPTAPQRSAIHSIFSFCRQNGENVPELPVAEVAAGTDCGEEPFFLFLTRPDGLIPAVLSLSILDEETAECRAVTAPAFRRQGYFSALLEEAETLAGERDLIFPLPDSCADGLAVMRALEAECLSTEYEMACRIPPSTDLSGLLSPCDASSCTNQNHTFPETARWTLIAQKPDSENGLFLHVREETENSEENPSAFFQSATADFRIANSIGSCLTTRISESSVCLHQVEIREDLRGNGFGTILICTLLEQLADFGIKRVILQVSGENAPALSLYKKTGFAITQSLSYYLY